MANKSIEELASNFNLPGVDSFDTNSFAQPGGGGSGAGSGGGGTSLAFDPYTSPYVTPRRIFFTINTYTNLSRTDVLAKAYLNGVEIEDQSNSKGRITFSLPEQRFLDPSTLTLVSGDLKPQKYFIIQARKNVENEVSIIEYDNTTNVNPDVIETPAFNGGGTQDIRGGQFDGSGGAASSGGGGGQTRDGGGGFNEVNLNDFRGAGFGIAGESRNRDEAQR
jgi:hypothetical protein